MGPQSHQNDFPLISHKSFVVFLFFVFFVFSLTTHRAGNTVKVNSRRPCVGMGVGWG